MKPPHLSCFSAPILLSTARVHVRLMNEIPLAKPSFVFSVLGFAVDQTRSFTPPLNPQPPTARKCLDTIYLSGRARCSVLIIVVSSNELAISQDWYTPTIPSLPIPTGSPSNKNWDCLWSQ